MEPEPPPLAGDHLASFERGREVYKICADCHHPQGWGIEGKAPPLVDSEWALGTEQRTVRMILHGMHGPKRIGDVIFNKGGDLEMPAMGTALNDQQIADVLTYVRREWENLAPQVQVSTVKAIREKEAAHEGPWSEKELAPFGPAPKDEPKKKAK
jgi:mono/diheme cytochrome c family protein